MRVLGLDLGLSCGWAVVEDGKIAASGTWDLRERRFSGGGMSMLRFRVSLMTVLMDFDMAVDHIAYEEVRQHKGTDAAHWYGGLYNTLLSAIEQLPDPIPTEAYPVGSIKKYATGKGNASKEDMLVAAIGRFQDRSAWGGPTEDEIDAIWIASYALSEITP